MLRKEVLDRIQKYVHPFRITKGKDFHLKDFDPADTCGLKDKAESAELLEKGTEWLAQEQDILYAQDRWSLLLVFQAMDAAGKDGTIKMSCPASILRAARCSHSSSLRQRTSTTTSCGATSSACLNAGASEFSTVLITRRFSSCACTQKSWRRKSFPRAALTSESGMTRLADIADFEDYLTRQGTIILKFFLHVSRKEQKKRFMERLDTPEKNWKFSTADVRERDHWDDYMHAFEEAIQATAAQHAPWYVVPADHKWFTRLIVAAAIVEAVEKLGLGYPQIDAMKKKELVTAREALAREP